MGTNTQRILAVLAAMILSVFIVGLASAQDQPQPQYPLTGLRFESPEGNEYEAYVEGNGRIWQPQLLSILANARVDHTVAGKLTTGKYVFNGVVCTLKVDEDRDGATYETTIGRGNGLEFSVNAKELTEEEAKVESVPVAWFLVECDGGASSGFDIWALEFNTQPGVQPQDPATPEADRMSLETPPVPTKTFEETQVEACERGAIQFVFDGATYPCVPEPTGTPPATATPPAPVVCDRYSPETGQPLVSQPGEDCAYGTPNSGTTGTTGGTGGDATPNLFQRIWRFFVGSSTAILVLFVLALVWWIAVIVRALRRNWVVGIGLIVLGLLVTPLVAAIIGEITLARARPSFWAWRPGSGSSTATTTTTTAS